MISAEHSLLQVEKKEEHPPSTCKRFPRKTLTKLISSYKIEREEQVLHLTPELEQCLCKLLQLSLPSIHTLADRGAFDKDIPSSNIIYAIDCMHQAEKEVRMLLS